jgi:hypothetical protein
LWVAGLFTQTDGFPFFRGMPSAPGKVPKYESKDRFSCWITITCWILWIPAGAMEVPFSPPLACPALVGADADAGRDELATSVAARTNPNATGGRNGSSFDQRCGRNFTRLLQSGRGGEAALASTSEASYA